MGYPLLFINNVIRAFKEKNIDDQNKIKNDNDDVPLTPSYFFEVKKGFVLFKLQLCEKNETNSFYKNKFWYWNHLGNI